MPRKIVTLVITIIFDLKTQVTSTWVGMNMIPYSEINDQMKLFIIINVLFL